MLILFLPTWHVWSATSRAAVPTEDLRSNETGSGRVEDSVVKIEVSKQPVDRGSPWQKRDISSEKHLGVVLTGGLVLTTAFAAADANFIEMQPFGSARKYELKPYFVDYEVNLAILKPRGDKALAGLTPMPLGDDLDLGTEVAIYRARDFYQLTKMPASLQDVDLYPTVTSSYNMVTYLFKSQQSGLGWSEPVTDGEGRLRALTTGQDKNFVHAIPTSIIKHFFTDHHDSGYRGFPSLGIRFTPLDSPDMRALLKADGMKGGIRVAQVVHSSPFRDRLEVDDVLLEVDGYPISEHGFYRHPRWGKIHLMALLNDKYGGDPIKLKVLRDGRILELEERLIRYDSNRFLVPRYRFGEPEPHLIFGGLVFQELSRNFLERWGDHWRSRAPYPLLYIWEFGNEVKEDPSERVIILNRVLADSFNRGYQNLRNDIVEAVNGVPATSLATVRQALSEQPMSRGGRTFARITLARGAGEVILAYDGLQDAHRRIARTYRITSPTSFFGSQNQLEVH